MNVETFHFPSHSCEYFLMNGEAKAQDKHLVKKLKYELAFLSCFFLLEKVCIRVCLLLNILHMD